MESNERNRILFIEYILDTIKYIEVLSYKETLTV